MGNFFLLRSHLLQNDTPQEKILFNGRQWTINRSLDGVTYPRWKKTRFVWQKLHLGSGKCNWLSSSVTSTAILNWWDPINITYDLNLGPHIKVGLKASCRTKEYQLGRATFNRIDMGQIMRTCDVRGPCIAWLASLKVTSSMQCLFTLCWVSNS